MADFVAPDNSVLSYIIQDFLSEPVDSNVSTHQITLEPEMEAIAITKPEFWRSPVSPTFHGRDIFAPVAARLSLGLPPQDFGDTITSVTMIPLQHPYKAKDGSLVGHILHIDNFGNLITDIKAEMLKDAPRDESVLIRCDEHETQGIFETYADQPPMTLVAVIGSSGKLELAIVDDSAKIMLGVTVGTPVTVSW